MQPVQMPFPSNYNNSFFAIKNNIIEKAKTTFYNYEFEDDILGEIKVILNTYDVQKVYLDRSEIFLDPNEDRKYKIIDDCVLQFIKDESKIYHFSWRIEH